MELGLFSGINNRTHRDYLSRVIDNKVEARSKAKLFDFDFFDGDRRYGYGGYKYLEGWWTEFANKIVKHYNLDSRSKVLDIGAGKGFLLKELTRTVPGMSIMGIDVSSYAISNAEVEIKDFMHILDARDISKLSNHYFDLVISINTLHNLSLKSIWQTLGEIPSICDASYIVVESFRNENEKFNVECWNLTAETVLSVSDWEFLFSKSGYTQDYDFIFFE